MDRPTEAEALARRYLLGELAEGEADDFEGRYLADEPRFERVREAEAQLIDDYWEGRLTRSERERFESHYLAAPRRRERARLAKDLIDAASLRSKASAPTERVNAGPPDRPGDTQQRRPYWAGLWTHAAAYATLAVGLAWLAVDDRRLRHEAGRHSEERGALAGRNQALSREIDALRQRMQAAPNAGQPSGPGSSWPAAAPSELWTGVMLRLGPGRVRGQDASAALIVATARARLELLLDLPDAGLHTYRAEIQTADGAVAARRGRLRARPMDGQWVVAFDLDRGLAAGDYVVVLTYADSAGRTAAAGEYFFRVVSR